MGSLARLAYIIISLVPRLYGGKVRVMVRVRHAQFHP